VEVFQGDDEDALENVLVGDFLVEGITRREQPVEILCRMQLDLDGILKVTAVEKDTGLSQCIVIDQVTRRKSDQEVAQARLRLLSLHGGQPDWEEEVEPEPEDPVYQRALELMFRLDKARPHLHPDDAGEADQLVERIKQGVEGRHSEEVQACSQELSELLFFVESAR